MQFYYTTLFKIQTVLNLSDYQLNLNNSSLTYTVLMYLLSYRQYMIYQLFYQKSIVIFSPGNFSDLSK